MGARTWLNLGLLVVALLLAAVIVLQPGIEPIKALPRLTTLDPSALSHIRIVRSGKPEVVLERTESGQWWLQRPLKARADDMRISRLLRITRASVRAHYPVAGVDLAEVGLQPPSVRLFLDQHELRFGGTESINNYRYVRIADSVYLINDFAYYHLLGGYASFVSPKLLPPEAGISALELPGLTLRREQGRWHVDPERERFSADQANRLVDMWRFATAMAVEPYSGGEGEPIRIQLEDKVLQFVMLGRSPELVLARPDLRVQYRFSRQQARELLQLPPLEAPEADLSSQGASTATSTPP